MTFDWNASYEWLAEEFRKETGLMAPAKDDPLCGDMHERRREWSKWFESRNEQAWREWHERHGMLAAHSAGAQGHPIDMLLFCPKCGAQHIDGEEWADDPHDIEHGKMRVWRNPPHRSHLCHSCGTIWRPADVPTNGVAKIETHGRADTWDAGAHPQPMTDAARDVAFEITPEIASEWARRQDIEHVLKDFSTQRCAIEDARTLHLAEIERGEREGKVS